VLVGVDGSPGAAHAVHVGQALARALDARLVLIHVYDPHVPFVSRPSKPLTEMARRHGREVLDQASAAAAAPFNTQLLQGDARAALAEACDRHAPAVLVVGSRGLGGFKELLLGSSARWLAGCAPCPVVVTRPPDAAA
jgi:nucleotide-binding universal stress UspA family protein